jgi:hypothetical protein
LLPPPRRAPRGGLNYRIITVDQDFSFIENRHIVKNAFLLNGTGQTNAKSWQEGPVHQKIM